MFIYSLKASTIRFFGIVCVALAALIALVAFVPTYVTGTQMPPPRTCRRRRPPPADRRRTARRA